MIPWFGFPSVKKHNLGWSMEEIVVCNLVFYMVKARAVMKLAGKISHLSLLRMPSGFQAPPCSPVAIIGHRMRCSLAGSITSRYHCLSAYCDLGKLF